MVTRTVPLAATFAPLNSGRLAAVPIPIIVEEDGFRRRCRGTSIAAKMTALGLVGVGGAVHQAAAAP